MKPHTGFDKLLWDAEPVARDGTMGLKLHQLSRDGEEGYPGNLDGTVFYWLQVDNVLRIDYVAETVRATPINLTNYTYFNLRGEGADDILGHLLTIHVSQTITVNAGLISTGEPSPVKDTSFGCLTPPEIGERVSNEDEQLNPSTILRPGKTYRTSTLYKFGAK